MGTTVEIGDLPEEALRNLERRAELAGMSLTGYVRHLLAQMGSRPTPEELRERIKARGRVELPEPSEVTVRRLRDWGE